MRQSGKTLHRCGLNVRDRLRGEGIILWWLSSSRSWECLRQNEKSQSPDIISRVLDIVERQQLRLRVPLTALGRRTAFCLTLGVLLGDSLSLLRGPNYESSSFRYPRTSKQIIRLLGTEPRNLTSGNSNGFGGGLKWHLENYHKGFEKPQTRTRTRETVGDMPVQSPQS